MSKCSDTVKFEYIEVYKSSSFTRFIALTKSTLKSLEILPMVRTLSF